MFGLLSSITACGFSLVFPVIASYKALAANDLSLIRPWLMYWIVLGMALSVEAMFQPLLALLPLYGTVRYFGMLWLVLPQTQGAVMLYTVYLEPWLVKHDGALDSFLVTAYVKARNFIVQCLNTTLGTSIATADPPDAGDSSTNNSASSLTQAVYSRFRLPMPADYNLSALISSWKSSSKAPKEYQENYSRLLEVAASLEKLKDEGLDSDGYDVIDSQPDEPEPATTGVNQPESTRKRWW